MKQNEIKKNLETMYNFMHSKNLVEIPNPVHGNLSFGVLVNFDQHTLNVTSLLLDGDSITKLQMVTCLGYINGDLDNMLDVDGALPIDPTWKPFLASLSLLSTWCNAPVLPSLMDTMCSLVWNVKNTGMNMLFSLGTFLDAVIPKWGK